MRDVAKELEPGCVCAVDGAARALDDGIVVDVSQQGIDGGDSERTGTAFGDKFPGAARGSIARSRVENVEAEIDCLGARGRCEDCVQSTGGQSTGGQGGD